MADSETALSRIETADGAKYFAFDDIPENSLYRDIAFNLYTRYSKISRRLLEKTWYRKEGRYTLNYGMMWFLRQHMLTMSKDM